MLHEIPAIPVMHNETTPFHLPASETSRRTKRPQILILTRMLPEDRAALQLGLQVAAARQADGMLLHVVSHAEVAPPVGEVSVSMHWLDAIGSLHRALGSSSHVRQRERVLYETREKMDAWLRRQEAEAPQLQTLVRVHHECAIGDIADEIERVAALDDIELVVLSSGLRRWGLPVLPELVHDLLKRIHKPVIVVRPDFSQHVRANGHAGP